MTTPASADIRRKLCRLSELWVWSSGTSPIYAFRESLKAAGDVEARQKSGPLIAVSWIGLWIGEIDAAVRSDNDVVWPI
jgi:hypothetical protein